MTTDRFTNSMNQPDEDQIEAERKRRTAESNQQSGVKQGNQIGQTATGNPLGDLITQVTNPFDGISQTKPLDTKETVSPIPPAASKATSNMSGFDAAKLANNNHQTVKYNVARILQQFPNTPDGLRQALPEIQKQYPQAKITGSKGDKVDFGDFTVDGQRLGTVDVLQAAGEGGKAWWWNPEGQGAEGGGAAPGTPSYQTYNFGQGGQGMQTIGPNTISQYKAGNVQQFNPADTTATQALVQQLLGKITSQASPDTSGIKEGQKELLNQLRADRNTSIDQNAAARGVSGGNPAALHANVEDAFAGDLTKSYRDIDIAAQNEEFDNLLQSLAAAQGVQSQLGEEGRANYNTGLQGTQLQEMLRQAEAASGQGAAGLNLQQQSILNSLLTQMRSLDLTQRGQDIGVDQFGKTLDRQKDLDWWNLILGNL